MIDWGDMFHLLLFFFMENDMLNAMDNHACVYKVYGGIIIYLKLIF